MHDADNTASPSSVRETGQRAFPQLKTQNAEDLPSHKRDGLKDEFGLANTIKGIVFGSHLVAGVEKEDRKAMKDTTEVSWWRAYRSIQKL